LGGFFKKTADVAPKNVTFDRVFKDFKRIAQMHGEGST